LGYSKCEDERLCTGRLPTLHSTLKEIVKISFLKGGELKKEK